MIYLCLGALLFNYLEREYELTERKQVGYKIYPKTLKTRVKKFVDTSKKRITNVKKMS